MGRKVVTHDSKSDLPLNTGNSLITHCAPPSFPTTSFTGNKDGKDRVFSNPEIGSQHHVETD